MLPVKGFLVLLIEAVASGQLAYIFFLSGVTNLWAVFGRFAWCLVFW